MPGNKLALGPATGRTRVAGHDVNALTQVANIPLPHWRGGG